MSDETQVESRVTRQLRQLEGAGYRVRRAAHFAHRIPIGEQLGALTKTVPVLVQLVEQLAVQAGVVLPPEWSAVTDELHAVVSTINTIKQEIPRQ